MRNEMFTNIKIAACQCYSGAHCLRALQAYFAIVQKVDALT